MNIILDNYTPLISYLSPASIPQIVAHIQEYLVNHPILSVQTVAEIIVQSLQEHPELLNGEAIPISADSAQSIKAYIDALPALDTYTKAEINALLLGKQDTLTFDQAPTPGSSNPVTSSGIIAALSALQTALETQIGLKADSASTYTKTQVDTLLEDKADADNVYSKNTIDAKLLEVDTELGNVNDALDEQSQQIANVATVITGTTNNSGHAISSGEYFIANGAKYKASATIDTRATWSDKSTSVSNHDLINALNGNITTLQNTKLESVQYVVPVSGTTDINIGNLKHFILVIVGYQNAFSIGRTTSDGSVDLLEGFNNGGAQHPTYDTSTKGHIKITNNGAGGLIVNLIYLK